MTIVRFPRRFNGRRELARERARGLAAGRYQVGEVFLEVWGESVDVSTYRCAICGGAFPETGRVLTFFDEHGTLLALHRGCYREDLGAWAYDPSEGDAA